MNEYIATIPVNGDVEIVEKNAFAEQFAQRANSYNAALLAELAKIASPQFEQLDIDIQLFNGINPTVNTNGIYYFSVNAQKQESGDIHITVGDRNGDTLGDVWLPLGCGVICLQNAGTNIVNFGFNADEQEYYSAKYNASEKTTNDNEVSLVCQSLEIKTLEDTDDEIQLGEFFIQAGSYNNSGSTQMTGTNVAIVYPAYKSGPAVPDTDETLPEAPQGSGLLAQTVARLNEADTQLLETIISTKNQVRQFFGIDDVEMDIASYPVDVADLRKNTNNYYYALVVARMLENGEMQVRIQRAQDPNDGGLDDARDGNLIADAFTPHGAVGLVLSACNKQIGYSVPQISVQWNEDTQGDYDVGYNQIYAQENSTDSASMQVLELTSNTTNTDWTVIGEFGIEFTGGNSNGIFPAIILSVCTPH